MRSEPLPEYPWETLSPYRERAAASSGGTVDLSVGSPVDETPHSVREALAKAADAPAYPTTRGSDEALDAIAAWFDRRRGVPGLVREQIALTVGSKEFVTTTPLFLGVETGDVLVQPELHYPSYEIGARFAGAEVVSLDDPDAWPESTRMVWLNSPGNPSGRVLDVPQLRRAVARARELGAVIVNDECYAELGWGAWAQRRVPSILDPRVTDGDLAGVLACSSLSKRSNLAGYRAAYFAGDPRLVARLVHARKHAGLIVPAPVQRAMTAALGDDAHADEQRARYGRRRELLLLALEAWGARIEHSEAGLYLWATRDEDAWSTIGALAELGILAGPGAFYGEAGARHVRIALTASDAHVAEAARRLGGGRTA